MHAAHRAHPGRRGVGRLRLAVQAAQPGDFGEARGGPTGCSRGCTNILFAARLTDMETAYKVFRRDVLQAISLRCVGFDIEPEITARVLQAGFTHSRVARRLQPAPEGRRQEDLVDRRHRRHLHASAVPRGRAARAAGRPCRASADVHALIDPTAAGWPGCWRRCWWRWRFGRCSPSPTRPGSRRSASRGTTKGSGRTTPGTRRCSGSGSSTSGTRCTCRPCSRASSTSASRPSASGCGRRALVSVVAGLAATFALAAGPAGHCHAWRRAGRCVAAGGELHVGDVLAGGAAGGDDGRRPGGVVGVLRQGRARLALGDWRGAASACSRSSRRPRPPSS